MQLKTSSAKCQPFCSGGDELESFMVDLVERQALCSYDYAAKFPCIEIPIYKG